MTYMLPKRFLRALKSPRTILSLLTVVALVVIIIVSRHELMKAWELLGRADLWLLSLLIPFQIIVYYAGGEMIFSYLRDKKLIKHVSHIETTRIALELNLVNHIFPSGGVSGISYATWRLHKLGVSSARATFAQMIRYVTGFVSLMGLLVVAVVVLAIDGEINRYIVASSFLLVIAVMGLTFALMTVFSSEIRMYKTARNTSRAINAVVRWVSFGKVKRLVSSEKVEKFFAEMQDDFNELLSHKKLLIKPLLWGLVYAIFDVAMFLLAFWALGAQVNMAILIVGYGVAGLVGLIAFTPGGAGVYEAIMIIFLSMAGVPAEVAIAGIVLTRVILLLGTIVFGYIFYQHALLKYGKQDDAAV